MKAVIRWRFFSFAAMVLAALSPAIADDSRLELRPHDHVILIGNTLAERMQYFGNFETLLHARFPQQELYVRDLGWSADEQVTPMGPYAFMANATAAVGAICGLPPGAEGAPSFWSAYFLVANVDASRAKAISWVARIMVMPSALSA